MSKKRNRTRTTQASTSLALPSAPNTPKSDQAAGEVPGKITKEKQGLIRPEQAFASTDALLIASLLAQAKMAAGFDPIGIAGHGYTLAAIHSLGARDGLEALLATQMVAVHNLAMQFLAGAALKDQTDVGEEMYMNRANRLLRTFTAQVETLKKYRSKGEQHFTVEHVHVHSGGQAVVGTINQGRTGTQGKEPGGRVKGNVEK